MMRDDDPKLTLDEAEWRAYKRATRNLRHRQRLKQVREAEPAAWLAAVDRDDLTDPAMAPTAENQRISVAPG